jgi:hypothetical protein
MCWGHAKRTYCLYPPSSKEDDLEKNMLAALETISLGQMQKYILLPPTMPKMLNQK